MIRFTLSFILFIIINSVFAQDDIIFSNGNELNGKILEVTDDLVKFKPADNSEGPVYSYKKSQILMIKYLNGKKEILVESKYRRNHLPKIYFVSDSSFKLNRRVFSYIIRTGWENAHDAQTYSYYNGNGGIISLPFFYNENTFYAEVLVGTRGKHYQYAAGFGAYFQNLNWTNTIDIYSSTQIRVREQSISIPLVFSNRIYFCNKKISPFLMVDISLMFSNVIPIKNNSSYEISYNNDTHWDYTFGVGLELKTNKKFKIQIESGMKKRTDWNFPSNRALFHSGISIVF